MKTPKAGCFLFSRLGCKIVIGPCHSAHKYKRGAATYNVMHCRFLMEDALYEYGCRELRSGHTNIAGSLETNYYCTSLANMPTRNDWRKR